MTCDVCGFDASLWSEEQRERTLVAGSYLAEMHGDESLADGLPREGVDPGAVHELMHRLHVAGRARHAATPRAVGSVEQLNVSGGGVPKLPVGGVTVLRSGVGGDVQADSRNHGRPWQAVCLWSADVIEVLAAEGHPIAFGNAGENVTVRGLDWGAVTPGARLAVGEALLHVWAYAIPCAKNAQWFLEGDFQRMSHETDPAGSRIYASVVREGAVRVGDAVVLEPT